MQLKSEHPEMNEWGSQTDPVMDAAELLVSELFEQADNDSMYHQNVNLVRQAYKTGDIPCEPEEIALCILAWSQLL